MMSFFKQLQPIFFRVTCIINKIYKNIFYFTNVWHPLYLYCDGWNSNNSKITRSELEETNT